MKKLLAMLCALVMLFSFAACSSSNDGASEASYVVGICQYTNHDSLDASTRGFKDALSEALGDSVRFVEENAGGEYSNCSAIANDLVSQDVDLILANATASLQACVSATIDIPILGTSITDYASALGIDDWDGIVGNNISGTSDLAPLDQQAAMLHELFPDVKQVGLLYCSGEPNSVYQVETITPMLEAYGYQVTYHAFTDVNDLTSVTQAACETADVLFIPTDNAAVSTTEAIANIVLAAGIPVVCGEEAGCTGCGVATLSIDYYELGYTTGQMAVKILTGETDISTMPIEYAPNVHKLYQADNCAALNITVPDDYEPITVE